MNRFPMMQGAAFLTRGTVGRLQLGKTVRLAGLMVAGLATAGFAHNAANDSAAKASPNKGASPQSMLVEAGALLRKLNDPGVRILDARSRRDFVESHVPGAVWVDVNDWKALSTADGGLDDAESWAEKVGELGIGQDTRVIVYGDSVSDTARIWWLLTYVGVKDVALLNGGWELWTKQYRPIETISPEVPQATFQPDFQGDRLVQIETLKESVKSGSVKLVDTRSTGEFTGQEVRGERGGHIPGAVHLEWKELLAEDGRFKSRGELRTLFRQRGVVPEDTAVCY